MYRIEYTRIAEKQIQKLERGVQDRIFKVLERARIRPEMYFAKLTGHALYRLKAGDYRIIADIQRGQLTILVVKVSLRENVYDSI